MGNIVTEVYKCENSRAGGEGRGGLSTEKINDGEKIAFETGENDEGKKYHLVESQGKRDITRFFETHKKKGRQSLRPGRKRGEVSRKENKRNQQVSDQRKTCGGG